MMRLRERSWWRMCLRRETSFTVLVMRCVGMGMDIGTLWTDLVRISPFCSPPNGLRISPLSISPLSLLFLELPDRQISPSP